MSPKLIFSASPHIRRRRDTQRVMLHVLIALMPAMLCSLYYFGLPALFTIVVSVGTCVLVEWAVTKFMFRRPGTLGDLTAIVTGLLLAFNLPSNLPWYMTVAGAVMAIGVAKMAFGGLGCNIFNPALVGRVFLLISFPAAMTTWPLPGKCFSAVADGVTGPTILSRLKIEGIDPSSLDIADLVLGNMGGSLGEVGAIAILIGLVYLLCVRVISWHIPVTIIAVVAVFEALIGGSPSVNILSGGLLLGAVFMATDYVTSPMTHKGMLIYAAAIGLITVVIRQWGAYPEGMSFAILIMNGFTPLINRYCRPVRFSERSVAVK